jgi:hypothetical protein
MRQCQSSQLAFSHDHNMVETFAPDRANQLFREWILPWRPRRGRMVTNPHDAEPLLECRAENTITVADEVSWSFFPRKFLGHLPRDPFCRRMRRGGNQGNGSAFDTNDHKNKEHSQINGWCHEQVDSRDAIGVIAEESLPTL